MIVDQSLNLPSYKYRCVLTDLYGLLNRNQANEKAFAKPEDGIFGIRIPGTSFVVTELPSARFAR